MYSILEINTSEYKTTKGVNKNHVAKISHSEYEDAWLKKKCLRHSMNRIQSKNHIIGTDEINEIYLSCFDYIIYIFDNIIDALAFDYKSD